MRALTVDVLESSGRVLCCTIFRAGGRKLLAKGHILSDEDVRLLATEGMGEVWVTELEEGEVAEDDAVLAIGSAMCCGSVEIRLAAGGRANLIATEDSCALIDDGLLRQINCASSVVVATVANFRYVRAGERLATVKSAPFAVASAQLEALLAMLNERGPILQARPMREPGVAVLYTDPVHGDRARTLFEGVMRTRLERVNARVRCTLACVEDDEPVSKALGHLLRTRPAVILVASTTAPAGPGDVIGRAMTQVGAQIESFLAPVEPGHLLLMGYCNETPVLSSPGCHRSAKPNVVDLLLPPLLARYRVSGWEIAGLGHGGLLG